MKAVVNKHQSCKTEAMFVFFYFHKLYFDNVQLNYVNHHKHIGVTLSQKTVHDMIISKI